MQHSTIYKLSPWRVLLDIHKETIHKALTIIRFVSLKSSYLLGW